VKHPGEKLFFIQGRMVACLRKRRNGLTKLAIFTVILFFVARSMIALLQVKPPSLGILGDHTPPITPRLRIDWSNLKPRSIVAKAIYKIQNNCSLPVAMHKWRTSTRGGYGLGSDLHVWSNYIWAGFNYDHRIRSPDEWLWAAKEECSANESGTSNPSWSSLSCYFYLAEPPCPGEVVQKGRVKAGICGRHVSWTDNFTTHEIRAGAMEFLFTSLSRTVIREAQRQLNETFGTQGLPKDLITIHIRWGDSAHEVRRKNVAVDNFVNAVNDLVEQNAIGSVHILLCTEDPEAIKAFLAASSGKNWTVYLDHFYQEYQPYRKGREIVYNLPSHIAAETNGLAGLWALGSLLVALEAKYFVLTTQSNWSRLINELRKNIIDASCGACTRLVDLREGEC
jgi:hypothetical protein